MFDRFPNFKCDLKAEKDNIEVSFNLFCLIDFSPQNKEGIRRLDMKYGIRI